MRTTMKAVWALLPMALLLPQAGCGGKDTGLSSGISLPKSNQPPVVQGATWAPADAAVIKYRMYTYTATATDPDIGDTIIRYEWDFGDGSAVTTTTQPTTTHAFLAPTPGGLKVRATDSRNLVGAWKTIPIPLSEAASPITVAYLAPAGAITLKADPSGGVDCRVSIKITDTSGGEIGLERIRFSPGDANAQVLEAVSSGDGIYTYTVRYLGDIIPSSRKAVPSVQVSNSLNYVSELTRAPEITIQTLNTVNRPPVIGVTDPATPTTGVYTSSPANLAFTLSDPDGDVINYTVNWGDGSAAINGTTGSADTTVGVPVQMPPHVFPDTFTTGTRAAIVTVTANDGRSPNGTAVPQTRTFNVTYNAFPVARILTPQASGFLPSPEDLPSNPSIGFFNPPGPSDPDIIVIANNGKLAFTGDSAGPGAGSESLTHAWTFQGGIPAVSSAANTTPIEVTFSATAGQYGVYLVEYKVMDQFGRWSTAAADLNPKAFRKWVVVDGRNTQRFNLSFMYRLKGDDNGTVSLAPARLAENGLGAAVQIFQDGISNTYLVQDQARTRASIEIPVRSNLPFYIRIPKFGSRDGNDYMMRIPNAPTGPHSDPALGTVVDPSTSCFGFQHPEAAQAPWDPTLQIVTAQGFAPETQQPRERRMEGRVNIGWGDNPDNVRWIDRLSIPLDDRSDAIQWVQKANAAGSFDGLRLTQLFAEWPILLGTLEPNQIDPQDPFTTAGTPADLGFILDYPKYTADTYVDPDKTETFSAVAIQAYRIPASNLDPYRLSSPAPIPGWNDPGCLQDLNPTPVDPEVSDFFRQMTYGAVEVGGIQWSHLPYDPNDRDRTPLVVPTVRSFGGIRDAFSYSEYLWSKVWERPLVLNHTNLSTLDTWTWGFAWDVFRYSKPAQWPAYPAFPANMGISPDNSAFNMNATGTGVFDNASPVSRVPAPPSATGVGRFYWTAYTPIYYGDYGRGSLITRTWLADGVTQQPPAAHLPNPMGGEATSALGFVPPQDATVDKRTRDALGRVVNDGTLNGYRVMWFNPTKDVLGNTVAPDFWVMEFERGDGQIVHFVIPANYPAVQATSSQLLTDARTFLPSGRTHAEGPAAGDTVAPGYCWVDIPVELRTGLNSALLTVFAVKSIHRIGEVPESRAVNRPEWLDAVKTVTAQISLKAGGGNSSAKDLAYGHKIALKFPWDVVVANSPSTRVAP